MRRVLFLVIGAALMLSPASVRAQGQTFKFTVHLSGANESPNPVLNGAWGTAEVTIDVSTQTLSWVIDIFNLPTGMVAGHFHVGGPGVSGPTVVNLTFPATISNDFRLTGSATALSNARPDQGIRSWEDFLQAVVGGQTYINIHTQANAGGEIRGQVVRVP